MGSFGRGNPIIWDIILRNLFILLVYQRVFTFARLNPNYYYFLGRSVSPGQLILYINTGRCCVARFKPEKERELLARFIIQFITGSPTPAQVIQNELLFRGDFCCAATLRSPRLQQVCRCSESGALGLQAALRQRLPKGESTSVPYLCSLEIKSYRSNFAPEPAEAARGRARCYPSQKADPKNYGEELIGVFTVRY